MNLSRREMLGLVLAAPSLSAAPRTSLGVASYSYHLRLAAKRAEKKAGLADPFALLGHCHQQGAGGIQTALGVRDAAYLSKLRRQADAWSMFLEGQVRLPQGSADVDRFTAELRSAKEAGITVLRTVLLSGRRYEAFASLQAFQQWEKRAWQSLTLAEPAVRKHNLRIAVENHKDYRAADLAALLKRLDSEHVGACLDTGNNLALLESPEETVEVLAPWAYAVHLKDAALVEYAEGFRLADVPLGEGILDLKKMVASVRKTRPEARFTLEMITRDPLNVPCLAPNYWITFPDLPGRDLAAALALARKSRPPQPLVQVAALPPERQLELEEEQIQKCLKYARASLQL